jgi:glycine cleavage system H protein
LGVAGPARDDDTDQRGDIMTTRYTKDHEYIRIEGDVGTVGITDYAQGQLGDVVYVELPTIGKAVEKGGEAAVVESVKAASEVYAPVSGEIVEVNGELEGAPGTVNEDPAGRGWFLKIRIRDKAELDGLLTEVQYQDFLKSIG